MVQCKLFRLFMCAVTFGLGRSSVCEERVGGYSYVGDGVCVDVNGERYDALAYGLFTAVECGSFCDENENEGLVGFYRRGNGLCFCVFEDGNVPNDTIYLVGDLEVGVGAVAGFIAVEDTKCYKNNRFGVTKSPSDLPTWSPTDAPTPLRGINPGAIENNGVYENGENCLNSSDCPGKTKGNKSNRFCCYGGPSSNVDYATICTDARCGSMMCDLEPLVAVSWCCGDGICAGGGETSINCPEDCN